MDPSSTIQDDSWFATTEQKLIDAIITSLRAGNWQAAYEDTLIGRAVFGRRNSNAR